MRRLAAQLALGLALAGCTLGPNYHRPTVSAPEVWRAAQAAPDPASLADLAWWELFQDDELRRLVQTATEANKDLRIAVTRVDQARAQLGVTRSAQFPEINAGASVTTNRFSDSDNVPPRGQGGQTDLFSTTVDLAFELDIWGRLRRATEAARAELLASEEARHAVVMTLVSDVAAAYLQLRQLDTELETTRANVASRRGSLQLVRDRLDAGLTSALDLRQAEAELAGTAAQIPDLERQIAPTVTLPIFNAARNRANLELVEARQREAVIRYEQAIQQAFREVEDALIAHRKAREALLEQEAAVRASREALSIAEFRYTSGLTSYLNVLDAQRTLLAAEIAESRTLLSQLVAVVQLYRALGGGWDAGLVTGKAPGGR